MKVSDYQKLYDILESVDVDETDKAAYCICYVLGYKPEKVDKFSSRQFNRNWVKAQYRIQYAAKPLLFNRINTDATKITFGQFIEVMHWMKSGVIESAHLIYATMRNTKNHKQAADKALKTNVRKVLPNVLEFMQSFDALLKRYSKLFEQPVHDPEAKPEPPHPFIERFGWQYAAIRLKDLHGFKLHDAYNLGVIEALNNLSMLKSQQQYEEYMTNNG